MNRSACLLGVAFLVVCSAPALPMTAAQRGNAIRALEEGDWEARTETDNLRSYMKLRPGCLNERDVTAFFDRRKRFSDLREASGSWRHADDDALREALAVMLDNAKADEQLAAKMKRRAKSDDC